MKMEIMSGSRSPSAAPMDTARVARPFSTMAAAPIRTSINSHTAVQSLYGLSNYDFKPDLSASAGFRYDHESGYTNSAGTLSPTTPQQL